MVWTTIVELLSNRKLIERQFEIWKKKQTQPQENADLLKKELEKQLDQFEDQETRYLKAYGEGAISLEQYKEQLSEIKGKKAVIFSQLNEFNKHSSTSQKLEIPDLDLY